MNVTYNFGLGWHRSTRYAEPYFVSVMDNKIATVILKLAGRLIRC